MKMKDIIRILEELQKLLASWDDAGAAPELERDMALEKLRAVYDGIKFPAAAVGAPAAEVEAAAGPEVEEPSPGMEEKVAAEVAAVVEEERVAAAAVPELPISPRPKVDKDVIRSLYGEDALITAKTATPAAAAASAAAAESGNGGQKKVFGETIPQQRIAINEKLARAGSGGDIADKLYSRSIVSIKQSIGVNDRFLIVRELFGGDADKFNETVAHLDEFTDFDDAMVYISENYSWNPDSPAVTQLVDLLERKLDM